MLVKIQVPPTMCRIDRESIVLGDRLHPRKTIKINPKSEGFLKEELLFSDADNPKLLDANFQDGAMCESLLI